MSCETAADYMKIRIGFRPTQNDKRLPMLRRSVVALACAAGLLAATGPLLAQRSETYAARLSWVPISGAERNDVAGKGSATATLDRSRLSVMGAFEGLPAAATLASLHHGVATGVRGPAIAALEITKAPSGMLSGEVELSRDQVAALRAGQLYVQVHAERGVAPDNAVLFGWLLAE
jgi:hypothetical protein